MVERQHDGVTALGLEDARQTILHAPVERNRTAHGKGLHLNRLVQSEILAFLHIIQVGHQVLQRWAVWAAISSSNRSNEHRIINCTPDYSLGASYRQPGFCT